MPTTPAQPVSQLTFQTAGGVTLEFFPDELIALKQEIEYHPQLKLILYNQADKDVYMQIAEIARYCAVLLHGTYTREDVVELCGKFVEILQKSRTISVHSGVLQIPK